MVSVTPLRPPLNLYRSSMPSSPPTWNWAIALVACAAMMIGCGRIALPQPDAVSPHVAEANEEDVPITEADVAMPANYAEAVERIGGYCETVRKALADNHPHGAHRALDEMDIVLNRLPEIARDSGVPKRHWEQVVVAGEEIRDLFNEIHAAIDDNRTPDYPVVAGRVEAALDSLSEVFEKTSSNP
jgi:hypothetical protein